MSRPYVRNRKVAQYGGYACAFLAAFLLYDAYERRGRKRSFAGKYATGGLL